MAVITSEMEVQYLQAKTLTLNWNQFWRVAASLGLFVFMKYNNNLQIDWENQLECYFQSTLKIENFITFDVVIKLVLKSVCMLHNYYFFRWFSYNCLLFYVIRICSLNILNVYFFFEMLKISVYFKLFMYFFQIKDSL